jgi:Outer membrane protein beta-barrel domain
MKKFFLPAIIALSVASVNAQDKNESKGSSFIFSLGVEPSLPIGDFHDFGYNYGIGGSLQGEYKASDNFGVTLNAGYLNYSAKDYIVNDVKIKGPSLGIVPVLAGVKYYFSPKVYGHGQLGMSVGTSTGSSSNFTYSPGVGFYISKKVDALVKFTGMSVKGGGSLNSIGARIAYNL